MYTFLTIYSIVVLVLLVFKIKWGLILYILMIFLLPSLSFTIGGIALKWNFFNLLLLFSLLFYVKRYHLNISISECKPFFWYFGVLFLFIPIEYELSYSYKLIKWFGLYFCCNYIWIVFNSDRRHKSLFIIDDI